ncbi:helix-turn-helix domain-containing protein [Pseudochelatococcus contaminans]|uniref:CRP/FNR family nitrogen fixation transcriptional regulator n=1 Tax=Pseudochelatococcus contaminans TaxID=1538103 RepID=A0A7W5Z206_9HYPH|nr:helix-turn-helix domain-containing protein [Pseudochelatococcus contaminans]MBB3808557.1 CRP/FNR family nitrogen fixation transcriptional regulator [Pseudochelatococcus contaminans]
MTNIHPLPHADFAPRAALVAPARGVNGSEDAPLRRQLPADHEQVVSAEDRIAALFAEIGTQVVIPRNGELYAEDQTVDTVFRVESGVVRTCKILNDGRRQIDGFYVAGDIVGLEMRSRHAYYAEAISRTTLRAVRLRTLRSRLEMDGGMSSALWDMTALELHRSQEHNLLLGRRSAQERVACLLLSMAQRLACDGAAEKGALTIELPMSRQDMADYLGLTIETVSRTFTQLEATGVIALISARKVRLCNRAALLDMHG